MERHRRRTAVHIWRILICAVGAALAIAASLLAAKTTGQLGGVVVDADGQGLADVTVETSSPVQIGGVLTAVTDQQGAFLFPRLTPGFYTVRAEVEGLGSEELSEVQVRLDRHTEVRIVLASVAVSESVNVVSTTPVVDPQQVSTGQTFTVDYIQQTRTDWADLMTQAAGTDPENFQRVLGSTPEANSFRLDGLDSTNWYGHFPNLAALNLPFDAVQEVAMHSGGFEAEYGQATGAVVNVVTKSGGNHFSGTVDARYSDSGLEESGEHYDPQEQESEYRLFSATLGGPLVRDRLWFFTSYSAGLERNTPTGAPVTGENERSLFLGKLSWSASPSWSLSGKYIYDTDDLSNWPADQFWAPEATSAWVDRPTIASAELVGQLAPTLLWTLRLGSKRWEETGLPNDGDLTTIGHVNLTTLERYGNYPSQYYYLDDQEDVSTDLSWFVGNGFHELDTGISWGRPTSSSDNCFVGNGRSCVPGDETFFFRDRDDEHGEPAPFQMRMWEAEEPISLDADALVLYVQDTWRPIADLTVKPGLRWDRIGYSNNTGRIAEFSKVQPRLGVAWDVTGNGRNLLRASWGQYMHPSTLFLAQNTSSYSGRYEFWYSCSQFIATDPATCEEIAREVGYRYRTDPEGWDRAGWVLPPDSTLEPGTDITVADDLEAAWVDHWLVGFERELMSGTSIELSYVHKAGSNLVEDTCEGNVDGPDPDASCLDWVVVNIPEARLDYDAWMLRFETQALQRLHLLASWVLSESKGSMSHNRGTEGDFDQYPYHWVNRYGYLPDHSRHRLKLNGYVRLPLDFGVAVTGWWSSELRWTPVELVVPGMLYGAQFTEPRGNRREDGIARLDLQLWKGFEIGPTRLRLIGGILNVFGSETPYEYCNNSSGCGEYVLGDPTGWQQPRAYELGLRVEF